MTAKGLKRVKKRYLCHSTQNPVQHFQIAQNTEKLYLVWELPSLTALVRLNPLVYLKQELSEADMHKIKTWWLKNLIQSYSMCYFIPKMIMIYDYEMIPYVMTLLRVKIFVGNVWEEMLGMNFYCLICLTHASMF